MIGRVLDKQETAQAAAKAELAKRPELLKSWLEGVTTRDGQPGQPAEKRWVCNSSLFSAGDVCPALSLRAPPRDTRRRQ